MGRAGDDNSNAGFDGEGIGAFRRGAATGGNGKATASGRKRRRAKGNDASTTRDEKRAALRAQLKEQVTELRSSQGWIRWLEVRSRFRHYSPDNQRLIAAQMPNATDVMGYKGWTKLGRHVKKGERAITIFGPSRSGTKERVQADGTTELVDYYYWPTHSVYDISQTDGEPLPPNPIKLLTGDSHAPYLDKLTAYAATLGYTVSEFPLSKFEAARINSGSLGLGGFCNYETKQIVLNSEREPNEKVTTLIHEIAHAHGVDYEKYTRDQAEVMVESVTWLVGQTIGLNTSDFSDGYIAGWDDTLSIEALEQFASTVDELAGKIEDGIGLNAKEARAEQIKAREKSTPEAVSVGA